VTLPQAIPFLNWSWDYFLFLTLVVVLLGSGIMVVLGRNIIHSGLWMIVCFGALAGLYVLLQAPLVAAAQVLVYIGAISVLVLFAIMLTQTKFGPARLVFHRQASGAALAAIVLAFILLIVVADTAWPGELVAQAGTAVTCCSRPWSAGSTSPSASPTSPSGREPSASGSATVITGILAFVARWFRLDVFLALTIASLLALVVVWIGAPLVTLPDGAQGTVPSLDGYLFVAGALFSIGVFGFLARRNAIAMLMSIELMLNAVNLSIIAFGAYIPALTAHASVIALMVMAVAAAEATVGLAIVIAIFRNRRTPLVDEYAAMSE
jgi:NADH:ubiquinone oxidoreductase subunit K/NADH:ubiquinone oxidoreductase subunit 6 (subunit J)